MRLVEPEQGPDVDVRDSVAVGEAKSGVVLQPLAQPLQSTPRLGVQPGVDEMHRPGRPIVVVDRGPAAGEVDRDVAVARAEVQEVVLDHLALVAQGNDEFGDTVDRIDVHDVPQDGLVADLHHGLRAKNRLFGESRPEPARQDYGFDGVSFLRFRAITAPRAQSSWRRSVERRDASLQSLESRLARSSMSPPATPSL